VKKFIVRIVLLIGILFPFAALMTVSESYAAVFEVLFGTPAAHILMHAALFAALTLVLLIILRDLPGRKRILLVLLTVPGIAVLQEAVPAASVRSLRMRDTLMDLLVDSIACGITAALYARRARNPEGSARSEIARQEWEKSGRLREKVG
jgi:hypothetical protein